MAKYRTHTLFNLFIVLPICIVLGALYFSQALLIYFSAAYIIGSLIINPDCDIAHKTSPFSLRGVLLYPFRFYSRVFRHRGISHQHIWGTLTRVLWLLIFSLPIWILIFFLSPTSIAIVYSFIRYHPQEILAAFCGLLVADSAHIFLDRF